MWEMLVITFLSLPKALGPLQIRDVVITTAFPEMEAAPLKAETGACRNWLLHSPIYANPQRSQISITVVLVTHFFAWLLHCGRDDCAIGLTQSLERWRASSLAIDTSTAYMEIWTYSPFYFWSSIT